MGEIYKGDDEKMKKKQIVKLCLVQLNAGQDYQKNFTDFRKYLESAAENDVDLIVTPEVTNLITGDHLQRLQCAAKDENDVFIAFARDLAKTKKVSILLGSLACKSRNSEKCLNRSIFINSEGDIEATYDKIHMFDIKLNENEVYQESKYYEPGTKISVVDAAFGKIGLSICYDIRFPSLYTALATAGAEIITVPSAFTQLTGEMHWEVLLRARAIETGSFIVAPAQVGKHGNLKRVSYGHSMVVEPGGKVLLNLGDRPGIGLVEIDTSKCLKYREKIPNLKNIINFSLV